VVAPDTLPVIVPPKDTGELQLSGAVQENETEEFSNPPLPN
jgi:hypothetical protein